MENGKIENFYLYNTYSKSYCSKVYPIVAIINGEKP